MVLDIVVLECLIRIRKDHAKLCVRYKYERVQLQQGNSLARNHTRGHIKKSEAHT